ncbi:MAG: hypothetical protein KJ556_02600 [Gammaproteobacteria bacterium]|nr:hypothetical protein [Gammaproteobacteria bacterium]MBU2056656.1 hypothetical protein [Gammaproteobacteria bacterium]MBU2173993.1 hypothetical protein [Gammaproteobacteria bacterium]MBU2247299.1 hypothetical protein [Gammaproteobacteria bacterium]MBU2344703.1 hypothetical protein [Gammaproteobacteria bacterium]
MTWSPRIKVTSQRRRGPRLSNQLRHNTTYDHELVRLIACIKGDTKTLARSEYAVDQMQLIDDAYKAVGLSQKAVCRAG